MLDFNRFALDAYQRRQAAGAVEILHSNNPLLAYGKEHGAETLDIDWLNAQLAAMPERKRDALGQLVAAIIERWPGGVNVLNTLRMTHSLLRMAERTGQLRAWQKR
ncbi:hypothetical protein GT93_05195 [Pseudomonas plecoglossicida]|nr:hypothetical protein GT93_05195 [Pseudomonas plecoglossicida]